MRPIRMRGIVMDGLFTKEDTMSTLTARQKQRLQFYKVVFPRLLDLIENKSVTEMLQFCELLGSQTLPCKADLDAIKIIHDLYNADDKAYMIAVQAFQYGKIQGIRAERARKKVRVDSSKSA